MKIVFYIEGREQIRITPSAKFHRFGSAYTRERPKWARSCDFFGMRRGATGCGRGGAPIFGGASKPIRDREPIRYERAISGISSGKRRDSFCGFCAGRGR